MLSTQESVFSTPLHKVGDTMNIIVPKKNRADKIKRECEIIKVEYREYEDFNYTIMFNDNKEIKSIIMPSMETLSKKHPKSEDVIHNNIDRK
ncbi:MAG: hypothetical protein ACYCTB_11750, partial [bacterium]